MDPKNAAVTQHPSAASPHSSDTLTPLYSLGASPLPHSPACTPQPTHPELPPAPWPPCSTQHPPPHPLAITSWVRQPKPASHPAHPTSKGGFTPYPCCCRQTGGLYYNSAFLCTTHLYSMSFFFSLSPWGVSLQIYKRFLNKYYHIFKPNQFLVVSPPKCTEAFPIPNIRMFNNFQIGTSLKTAPNFIASRQIMQFASYMCKT